LAILLGEPIGSQLLLAQLVRALGVLQALVLEALSLLRIGGARGVFTV
jgi:hypothetical protein